MNDFLNNFLTTLGQTSFVEAIAVIAGIASVWFSSRENVLVYPIGLINTLIFVYISIKGNLFGEASVNLYYSIMSLYGWLQWSRKDPLKKEYVLKITHSTKKGWLQQLTFFSVFYVILYGLLTWMQQAFTEGVIPWADALASASAYTGMWLMTRKKTESWLWWIVTNLISIPLFYTKGYAFTSVQFLIMLILAIVGYIKWNRKAITINHD